MFICYLRIHVEMFNDGRAVELPLGSISEEICNSKVGQLPLDSAADLGLAEDVVRLEIPVEDVGAPAVQVAQGAGKLVHESPDVALNEMKKSAGWF